LDTSTINSRALIWRRFW